MDELCVMGDEARVPVLLLTGFLGSGKTTLINRLTRTPQFADAAVIVNELGDIGIDHALIAAGDDDVVLLDSGCLCCMAAGTLRERMEDLWFRRRQAAIPRFRRLVIETSGLADPTPIVQTLITDDFIARRYGLDGIVTVVDAMFGEAQLEQHREAFNQAALADRLILSKTDVATPTRAARIERRLRSLNPVAPIYRIQHGQVDPLVVLDIGSFRIDESPAEFGPWLGLGAGSKVGEEQAKPPHDGHCDDHHDHAPDAARRHGGEVHAHSFFLDGPVGWLAVEAWIDFLRDRFGDDLLRCKGLIEIAGTGKPVLIQGVQTVFDRPLPLAAWPRGLGRSCLVLIGRGLDPDAIAKSLQVLRGCSGPSAADRRKCHDD